MEWVAGKWQTQLSEEEFQATPALMSTLSHTILSYNGHTTDVHHWKSAEIVRETELGIL